MLGYLRDSTGGFTAGWLFVAFAAVVSLADLLLLRARSSRVQAVKLQRSDSRAPARLPPASAD
jgi:hypothetical protein